ncbi:MAG: hypothetical protein WAS36_01155 [Candidatus Saccharimonadales bacterium]
MSEQLQQRLLPRAVWQRTVGAVLMNEILGAAFDGPVLVSAEPEASIRVKEDNLAATAGYLGEFWRYAYATNEYVVGQAVNDALNESELAKEISKGNNPITSSLKRFTFNGGINAIMQEAGQTAARFPLNLVRSIGIEMEKAPGVSHRYQVQSYNQLAELITADDFRATVDDALVTNNEYWGASSVAYSDFAASDLREVQRMFEFESHGLRFSQEAIMRLHSGVRSNNRHVLSESDPNYEPSHFSRKSTSGCPARHTSVNLRDAVYMDELMWIARVQGKTVDELGSLGIRNLVQRGLTYSANALHEVESVFMPELDAIIQRRARLYSSTNSPTAVEQAKQFVFRMK